MLYLSAQITLPPTTSDATLFCGILAQYTISMLFPGLHCVEFTVYMPVFSVDSWVRIFDLHFSSLSDISTTLSPGERRFCASETPLWPSSSSLPLHELIRLQDQWDVPAWIPCLPGFHVYQDPMVPASRLYSNYPVPKNSMSKWSGSLPFKACIGLSPISIFQRRE